MTYESDALAHYGVKGQKHGIRRYQNEDGSLTAEGREHYGVGDSSGHAGPNKAAGRFDFIMSGRTSKGMSGKAKTDTDQNAGEEKKQKNHDRAKKIVAAAAATTLAAVAAYAVAKQSTKMRDNYRKLARIQARKHLRDFEMASVANQRARKELELDRTDPSRTNQKSYIRGQHLANQYSSKKAMEKSKAEHEKYKKIAETANRRDAFRYYLDERHKKGKKSGR